MPVPELAPADVGVPRNLPAVADVGVGRVARIFVVARGIEMVLRISNASKSLSNVRVAVKLVDPLFRYLIPAVASCTRVSMLPIDPRL